MERENVFWDKTHGKLIRISRFGLVTDIATGGASETFKVYTALLSQSGTDDPTVNILENTTGDIVWTRGSIGFYIGTLNGAFQIDKTIVSGFGRYDGDNAVYLPLSNGSAINGYYNIGSHLIDNIDINVVDASFQPAELSDILVAGSILVEIKIYN